jgi:hypothetical protein
VEVSGTAMGLARLAMSVGAGARLAARDHYLEESGVGESGWAVVLGRDPPHTDSFLADFWFDYIGGRGFGAGKPADGNDRGGDGSPQLLRYPPPRPGLPGLMVLFAGNGSGAGGGSLAPAVDFARLHGDPSLSESCVFFLTDGLQAGGPPETLLLPDDLLGFLKACRKLVLTLRSFRRFASGRPDKAAMACFAESLRLLKDCLVDGCGLPIRSFMANSRELGLSVLGDLFFRCDSPLKELGDRDVFDRFSRISDGLLFTWFAEGLRNAGGAAPVPARASGPVPAEAHGTAGSASAGGSGTDAGAPEEAP